LIGVDQAVTIGTSKRDALARIEAVTADCRPVNNEQKRFAGTVDRNKPPASLILELTDKLEGR